MSDEAHLVEVSKRVPNNSHYCCVVVFIRHRVVTSANQKCKFAVAVLRGTNNEAIEKFFLLLPHVSLLVSVMLLFRLYHSEFLHF